MLSVSSVASAAQQITIIHRLEIFPRGLQVIRQLLGEPRQSVRNDNEAAGALPQVPKFNLSQRFLWQIPVMLLNGSLYLFTAGLCILVYWDFTRSFGISATAVRVCSNLPVLLIRCEHSDLKKPIAACFFSFCVISGIVPWGISSIGLYYWVGKVQ
jgi:hypothetical protein